MDKPTLKKRDHVPSPSEQRLREFLDKVTSKPKTDPVVVRMKNGGYAVVKRPV